MMSRAVRGHLSNVLKVKGRLSVPDDFLSLNGPIVVKSGAWQGEKRTKLA